jgi:hypothetical protein
MKKIVIKKKKTNPKPGLDLRRSQTGVSRMATEETMVVRTSHRLNRSMIGQLNPTSPSTPTQCHLWNPKVLPVTQGPTYIIRWLHRGLGILPAFRHPLGHRRPRQFIPKIKRPKIKIKNPKSEPAIMGFGFWNLPVTVTMERPEMESERERDAV